jgi:hypothetical protein
MGKVIPYGVTIPQPVNQFSSIMENEGSLQQSQQPATCPYPQLDLSSSGYHYTF